MQPDSISLELEKTKGKPQPLYLQIANQMKRQIHGRVLKPGQTLPAVSEMVRQWNVGYSTVLSALKCLEKEGLVAPNKEWGKGPVILPLIQDKKTVHIAFPRWCACAQFLSIESGIRQYAQEHHLSLTTSDALESDEAYRDAILHPAPDTEGLVLYLWDTPAYRDAVKHAIESGIKVVLVDRTLADTGASSVFVDHFKGAYEATRHLIEQHQAPVFYLGPVDKPSSVKLRFEGYCEAMHESGYQIDPSLVFEFKLPESDVALKIKSLHFMDVLKQYAAKFLQTYSELDKIVVFGVNDDTVRGLCMAAPEFNRQMGVNLFAAGFGNKPFCQTMEVPLTSVAQFDDKVGYEAAKLLHHMIIGKQRRAVNVVVAGQLIVRASSLAQQKVL